MESIAQAITQPGMVFVFVAVILLVALMPLYQAIFSIRMVNRDLDSAIRILIGLGKNQQDEFYNQFKAVNTQILRIPGLRHAWREFVDSMYFESAALPNPHKKAYLSHRPSRYFNRESVLGTRLNLSQFFAYPNYLIGIGLTLTFIGLAAALHVAQAGLASGAGQQALKDLLAVASVKFISSIAGIASSLAVSALQRIRIRLFQQKLDMFCDLLEECTKYKSTEKLLHDSLNGQRIQTAALSDMAKNIAMGINEVISKELSAGIAYALDPLMRDIRSLAQNFAEGSESALKKMIAEFLSALHQTSAHEMQGLVDSAKTLRESLDGLVANMQSAGRDMSSDVKASARHLAETLENVVTSLASVQQGAAQFSQSTHSLESVADKLEKAGGDIHGAAGDNKKAAVEFGKSLAPIQELLATLPHSLRKAEETALNLREAGGIVALAAEEYRNSALMMENSEGRFNQKIKSLEASAEGLVGTLAALESASRQADSVIVIRKNGNGYFSKLKSRWLK